MTIQQQWAGCGRLWRALDSETQRQYDDPEFLKTLPKPFLAFNEEDVEGESEMPGLAGPSLARKDKPRGGKHKRASKFVPVRWGRKILADLSHLTNSHGVEGFIALVYHQKQGQSIFRGGSWGEAFIDMFPRNEDPCQDFLEFVKGQAAIRNVLGAEAPLPKRMRKRKMAKNAIENCKYDKGGL